MGTSVFACRKASNSLEQEIVPFFSETALSAKHFKTRPFSFSRFKIICKIIVRDDLYGHYLESPSLTYQLRNESEGKHDIS